MILFKIPSAMICGQSVGTEENIVTLDKFQIKTDSTQLTRWMGNDVTCNYVINTLCLKSWLI